LAVVLGPNQHFQHFVEVPFDPFAQHETMIAREFAGVVARPQDQIVSLRHNDQFLMPFQVCHVNLLNSEHLYKFIFNFAPPV
jgi:hypothetical protein